MITLPTELLRKFLSAGASVKLNVLFPALDNIKIEGDGENLTLTKTNMNVFCVMRVPDAQTFAPVLINERALAGLLLVTAEPTVTLEGNLLIAGRKKVELPPQDARDFPVTPARSGEVTAIPPAVLAPLKIAAKYYARLNVITWMSFVHADQRGVFATNGHMSYYNRTPAPTLFLEEDVIITISGVGDVYHQSAGNYDAYFNSSVAYFFVKKESVFAPYDRMFEKLVGDQVLTVDRTDLLKFCQLVQYTSKQESPVATWQTEGAMLLLKHEDADFGTRVDEAVVVGGVAPLFKFNIKTVAAILESLPYTTLQLTYCNPHYKIATSEDAAYTGVISALA